MQGKDSSGGYFAFQAAIYSCPNSKLPHRHLMLSFISKVIDQLDKKRKVFQAILDKGTALTQKPKSPEFLGREVKLLTIVILTCKYQAWKNGKF